MTLFIWQFDIGKRSADEPPTYVEPRLDFEKAREVLKLRQLMRQPFRNLIVVGQGAARLAAARAAGR